VLLPSSVLRWIEQEVQGAAGSLGGGRPSEASFKFGVLIAA
jgi:hypothetical protein